MNFPPTFPRVMTLISDFLIIYIFRIFLDSFSTDVLHYFASWCDFTSFLLTVTFFSFQNQLYFLRVLLKKHKTFSYNLFHIIKYVYLLFDQTPKLLALNIHKEYIHLFYFILFFFFF